VSAQIIPFPRQKTSAELCREMAFSVSVSDPEELAVLLERRGFADDPAEARRMIDIAQAIFPKL
jgi:hypothetical protein